MHRKCRVHQNVFLIVLQAQKTALAAAETLIEPMVACLQQPLLNARRTAALVIKSGLPFSLGLLESGDSLVINWRLVFCVLLDDLAEVV